MTHLKVDGTPAATVLSITDLTFTSSASAPQGAGYFGYQVNFFSATNTGRLSFYIIANTNTVTFYKSDGTTFAGTETLDTLGIIIIIGSYTVD